MIVILGAFGRTGSVVADLARRRAEGPVRLVTRQPRESRAKGMEVAVARLSEPGELCSAFRRARALFALLPDDLHAAAFHAERRAMADAIAAAVRRERVPRVVLLSSSAAALGEPASDEFARGLGADLAYFERVLGETEAELSVIRAGYFQENVLAARPMAEREGMFPSFLPPGCCISTVASTDVAAVAAAQLFTQPGSREVIDLVGPSYTPERMAELLGEVVGRTLTVSPVPALAQAALFRQWMSAEAASAMVETFAQLGSGRVPLAGTRRQHASTRLEQTLSQAFGRALTTKPEVAR